MSNNCTDEGISSENCILAVDTSSPRASYAIIRAEKVLASLSTSARALQSQAFFTNISTLLDMADLKIEEIGAFAAVTGPGSFTGLRVGLAAVKGMAYALGRPTIGVNSIDATALSAGIAGPVLVMLEAGRGEVYAGLRRVGGDGTVVAIDGDEDGDGDGDGDRAGAPSKLLDDLREMLPASNDLVIVGEGAARFRADLEGLACRSGTELVTVSHFSHALGSWQLKTETGDLACAVGRYAARLMRAGNWPGIAAYYIRPSDAETKRRASVRDEHE